MRAGQSNLRMYFFEAASRLRFERAKLVAFGSTRKAGISAEDDPNLRSLVGSKAPAVAIFGKSWDRHVRNALKIPLPENLELIADSVSFLKRSGVEVVYDAEHFFDGYKAVPDYALSTLEAAAQAGADWLVLCDTNGGTLPGDVRAAVDVVAKRFDLPLGIHAHNDADLAVANSLAAVEGGATMVQGTINGIGERCGNANLCSIMPTLALKMGREISVPDLTALTSLSNFISETANVVIDPKLPYVGRSAFAHKAGVHVNALMKDEKTYGAHRPPPGGQPAARAYVELIGNGVDNGQDEGVRDRHREGVGRRGPESTSSTWSRRGTSSRARTHPSSYWYAA